MSPKRPEKSHLCCIIEVEQNESFRCQDIFEYFAQCLLGLTSQEIEFQIQFKRTILDGLVMEEGVVDIYITIPSCKPVCSLTTMSDYNGMRERDGDKYHMFTQLIKRCRRPVYKWYLQIISLRETRDDEQVVP